MHNALASQHEQPHVTAIIQSNAQSNAQLMCITARATSQKLRRHTRHAEQCTTHLQQHVQPQDKVIFRVMRIRASTIEFQSNKRPEKP